jgi:hypothetical protein
MANECRIKLSGKKYRNVKMYGDFDPFTLEVCFLWASLKRNVKHPSEVFYKFVIFGYMFLSPSVILYFENPHPTAKPVGFLKKDDDGFWPLYRIIC